MCKFQENRDKVAQLNLVDPRCGKCQVPLEVDKVMAFWQDHICYDGRVFDHFKLINPPKCPACHATPTHLSTPCEETGGYWKLEDILLPIEVEHEQ